MLTDLSISHIVRPRCLRLSHNPADLDNRCDSLCNYHAPIEDPKTEELIELFMEDWFGIACCHAELLSVTRNHPRSLVSPCITLLCNCWCITFPTVRHLQRGFNQFTQPDLILQILQDSASLQVKNKAGVSAPWQVAEVKPDVIYI